MQNKTKITRIQKLIGDRMLASKRQIPCFYLHSQVDLTDLATFRKKTCRKAGIKAGTNEFFFKAMANAIVKYPLFAGQFKDDRIEIADSVNIGFAVDAPHGLVVPVIKDCEKKEIPQIANEMKNLANDARSNKLSVDQLNGACISLSSLGMFGLTGFIAIVPPNQASILAIGKIIEKPMVINGEIVNRKMMNLNLSVDHRIINGAYAAGFLKYLVDQLENPHNLVTLKEKAAV